MGEKGKGKPHYRASSNSSGGIQKSSSSGNSSSSGSERKTSQAASLGDAKGAVDVVYACLVFMPVN